MSNEQASLDRACELAGKLGGIHYEAGVCANDVEELLEWIGKGQSRKTRAMQSLCESLKKRLASIRGDSK
jgi:hypothetical protein